MIGHPTINFSDTETGLFTPEEIRGLMRIDFERAQRYEYAVALMVIEVDRLEYLHDLYGFHSKEEILSAVVGLLRSVTRASDFLGCLRRDRVMALFPHTGDKAVNAIAGRLLQGTRKLQFESDGRSLQATLSVGVAVCEPGNDTTYEDFVEAAEDALAFASVSGGDRFVTREAAATVFEDLREELETEARALHEEHERLLVEANEREARALAAAAAAEASLTEPEGKERPRRIPIIEDLPETDLRQGILDRFDAMGALTPELQALRKDVVRLAEERMHAAFERAMADKAHEHEQHVSVLERRVEKLKQLLDDTELELKSMAKAKQVDPGVASIYRTVQGLDEDDAEHEKKREMLSILFEANVDMRRKIKGDS